VFSDLRAAKLNLQPRQFFQAVKHPFRKKLDSVNRKFTVEMIRNMMLLKFFPQIIFHYNLKRRTAEARKYSNKASEY